MKTTYIMTLGILAALQLHAEPAKDEARVRPDGERSKVQIAILLDTSSSMNGLIDQARTQLWKVVNTFIGAHRDGKTPFVEVALYEYGNNALNEGNNYIRQIEPLSRDLDEISRELFALQINGGEEYCGAVIQHALSDLSWDTSEKTYKAIFIAGNESFKQGRVDSRQACKNALKQGIVINTIHCGTRDEGIADSWHDGAALAEGKFMVIDQDRKVAHVDAPQDKMISELSTELNKTYLGYGKTRKESAEKQKRADVDATSNAIGGADVQRAVTKASANYSNVSWDLVDACREKKVNVAEIAAEELPAEMRQLKPDDRAVFVEKAANARKEIQSKISELNQQRELYVAAEMKKQATDGEQTLDEVLVETTRAQASALGYLFKK